jgi:hypothetical protein
MIEPRQSLTPKKMPVKKATARYLATPEDDEDDGWDTTELDSLRGQRLHIQPRTRPTADQQQAERDLFIPIVSLVSLAGLFGTYTYEMLRLYSRGELYLPWEH